MSSPVDESMNVVYAINRSMSPPDVWMTQWSTTTPASVILTMPPGFVQVSKEVYDQAVHEQQMTGDRAEAQSTYQYRTRLSQQRHDLVDAGLTYEQACILAPDPGGDYSIDDAWRS